MADTKPDTETTGAPSDRSTERRLVAARAAEGAVPSVAPRASLSLPADSVREHEDFVFHLYRGSELLQDNRVLEAKEELEYALTIQPRDAKGQDLLAAVYFRLGLYPRAISIYENLLKHHISDPSLRLNVSLCYLKTGQPEAARASLMELIRQQPQHKRAWGYLGLVHEKLGDYEQAQIAYERGGHGTMARRMLERRSRATVPAPAIPPASIAGGELREVAGLAFEELDAGMSFALAEQGTGNRDGGTWHAIELGAPTPTGRTRPRSPFSKTLSPPSIREPGSEESPAKQGPSLSETTPPPADFLPEGGDGRTPTPVVSRPPPPMLQEAQRSMLVFPSNTTVAQHPAGLLLVQTANDGPHGARPFATRLEALRVAKGAITTTILQKRVKDKETAETLGGVASPIVAVRGNADLVLGPRHGHRLVPLELHDEIAFVREDLLLGFELRLSYENGRISADEGEPLQIVQLRGTGTLVLELFDDFMTIDATPGRAVFARREWIVGWLGRLVPRPIPASEAPSGQRGLVSFSGEGTVLVAGR